MSARKKLYEITTIEGEVVEPSISIQELIKMVLEMLKKWVIWNMV